MAAPAVDRRSTDRWRPDGRATVGTVPEGDTVYLAGKRLRAALTGRTLLRGELRHPRLVEHDLAGRGNLYKAEVCFLLGLSPWTLVRDVPDPAKAIALSRTLLLRNADRPEQSTTGELARGRQHWVYERAGQRCRRCGTRIRTAEQ